MPISTVSKLPLAATLFMLAGCVVINPSMLPSTNTNGTGTTTATTSAVELSAPPLGTTRSVTIRGAVSTTSGPVTTSGAQVRIKSVTPHNPFDRTVPLEQGRYVLEGVPTSMQYVIGVLVPGQTTKVRLETLLSTSTPERTINFGGRYDAADPAGDSYVVGAEWCKEDPVEKQAAAALANYRALEDIPVFTAQPLDTPPPSATPTPQPSSTGTIPVDSASPIDVVSAQPVTPCMAHPVRIRPAAGIEQTPQQGPVDARLVGSWKTAIPGAAWSTETRTGNLITTETHVGTGAGLGDLAIHPDGSYQWVATTGKLRQVMPFNDAAPNTAYWLVRDPGGKDHYCTVDETGMLVFYLPGTNAFIAQGTRLQ